MQNYCFDQSEADTVISPCAVLRESGYTGPDASEMDVYVTEAFISKQLLGLLYIKGMQKTVIYRDLLTEMAVCNVQLYCMAGCDANSSLYGEDKGMNSSHGEEIALILMRR